MSAAMDVAYLGVPHVAHVERKAFLLRMDLHCWEETCWACTRLGCACACHDDASQEAAARQDRDRVRREAAEARARLLECTAEYFRRRP